MVGTSVRFKCVEVIVDQKKMCGSDLMKREGRRKEKRKKNFKYSIGLKRERKENISLII